MDIKKILNSLGIESENSGAAIGGDWLKTSGDTIISVSPVDGQEIGSVVCATEARLSKLYKCRFRCIL